MYNLFYTISYDLLAYMLSLNPCTSLQLVRLPPGVARLRAPGGVARNEETEVFPTVNKHGLTNTPAELPGYGRPVPGLQGNLP